MAAALIKQFTHLLPHAPNPGQALRQFSALCRRMIVRAEPEADLSDLADPAVLDTLSELMGVSRFLWEDFLRVQHENLFPVLADTPALDERKSRDRLARELQAEAPVGPRELNAFKDRELFRIDLRHITRRIGFGEFSRELAELAESVVAEAAVIVHRQLGERYGAPALADGRPCRWMIAALGKFGGREIGFASDLELIFVYEGAGETGGAEAASNAQYFEQFVQRFREIIVAPREGIFELDLRLRPHGDDGALATGLEAFRGYYSTDGGAQQFERIALVRLRPVAGDEALGAAVVGARDAFVYSGEALDLDNVRHLRRRQTTQLVRPGEVNAKYSPGGVVDIEYYVQARQIESGARDPSVRLPGTLEAVEALAAGGHIDQDASGKLQEAYGFLRRLIDALWVVRGNARDLTIPARDSREFAYLARRLYYDSPRDLDDAITVRMDFAGGLWGE